MILFRPEEVFVSDLTVQLTLGAILEIVYGRNDLTHRLNAVFDVGVRRRVTHKEVVDYVPRTRRRLKHERFEVLAFELALPVEEVPVFD